MSAGGKDPLSPSHFLWGWGEKSLPWVFFPLFCKNTGFGSLFMNFVWNLSLVRSLFSRCVFIQYSVAEPEASAAQVGQIKMVLCEIPSLFPWTVMQQMNSNKMSEFCTKKTTNRLRRITTLFDLTVEALRYLWRRMTVVDFVLYLHWNIMYEEEERLQRPVAPSNNIWENCNCSNTTWSTTSNQIMMHKLATGLTSRWV